MNANASSSAATAIGLGSSASNTSALAVGNAASASGSSATAIGTSASASGANAYASGVSAQASGTNAYAGGVNANASGDQSTAIGNGAQSAFSRSTAIGTGAATTRDDQVAIGVQGQSYLLPGMLTAGANFVGQLYQAGSVQALTVDSTGALGTTSMPITGNATGANAQAIGVGSTASGNNSVAIGTNSTASGDCAVAMGQSATASGRCSVAAGGGSLAVSSTDVAIGAGSTADNQGGAFAATAIGRGALAQGNGAVAIGDGAFAADPGTAVGTNAAALGVDSSAYGFNASSSGLRATAIGTQSSAGGTDSLALGSFASAPFSGSTAIGTGAASTRPNQVMIGTSATSYTLPGLATGGGFVGGANQQGSTRAVTVDAQGNLGTNVDLDSAFRSLGNGINSMGAMTAALSALPNTVSAQDEWGRCGVAGGSSGGVAAGALGCSVRLGERIHLNGAMGIGPSYSYQAGMTSSLTGRIGVSFPLGTLPRSKAPSVATLPSGESVAQAIGARDTQIAELTRQIGDLQSRIVSLSSATSGQSRANPGSEALVHDLQVQVQLLKQKLAAVSGVASTNAQLLDRIRQLEAQMLQLRHSAAAAPASQASSSSVSMGALERRINEQDVIIQTLIRQLHALNANGSPAAQPSLAPNPPAARTLAPVSSTSPAVTRPSRSGVTPLTLYPDQSSLLP